MKSLDSRSPDTKRNRCAGSCRSLSTKNSVVRCNSEKHQCLLLIFVPLASTCERVLDFSWFARSLYFTAFQFLWGKIHNKIPQWSVLLYRLWYFTWYVLIWWLSKVSLIYENAVCVRDKRKFSEPLLNVSECLKSDTDICSDDRKFGRYLSEVYYIFVRLDVWESSMKRFDTVCITICFYKM